MWKGFIVRYHPLIKNYNIKLRLPSSSFCYTRCYGSIRNKFNPAHVFASIYKEARKKITR
jgi:hypothetical protein